jgi:hypothetical protein
MKTSNYKKISDFLSTEPMKEQINFKEFQFQIEVGLIWFSSLITLNFYVLFFLFCLINKLIWTFERQYLIFFSLTFILILLIFISSYLQDFMKKIRFRNYLESCIFIFFYGVMSLALLHFISLPSLSLNKFKLVFMIISGMFFFCLVFYNSYKNYLINKMKNRIIYLENLNQVFYEYIDNFVDRISCLFYTFKDLNCEEDFSFINPCSRDFIENKIVPNLNRENFNDLDYEEYLTKKILKSEYINKNDYFN